MGRHGRTVESMAFFASVGLSFLGLSLGVFEGVARADEGRVEPSYRIIERPHTIALVEAGIIALPYAPISASLRGGETPFGAIGRGDATVQTGLHALYRPTVDWAIGAGVMFGPKPSSDRATDPVSLLDRTHSRSYFRVGGEIRYFPLRFSWFEVWMGINAGEAVVADRYATNSGRRVPPIVGTPEVTVRTEGIAVGVQLGADWMFADRWVAGATLRSERWLLPNEQERTSLGDPATLAGIIEVVQFGLSVGYRVPL